MSNKKQKDCFVYSDSNPILRKQIESHRGVFSFSENQQLFCNFCRIEIIIEGEKDTTAEVNNHISCEAHVQNVNAFKQKDKTKRNTSLIEALKDEILTYVSDGFVRCVFCKIILNDSLTNLKNHLVSLDHIFEVFAYGSDGNNGNLKRKSARMIYLVAQTAELDFHKENNVTKVLCKRCEYIVEPTYQSVKYHLDSKKHNSKPSLDLQIINHMNKKSSPINSSSSGASESKYKSRKTKVRTPNKKTKISIEDDTTENDSIQVQPDMIALTDDSYYVVQGFSFEDEESFDQIIVSSPDDEEINKPKEELD